MTQLLFVLAERMVMGEIRRSRRGQLAFVYSDAWRSMAAAYPLSLSMPLIMRMHDHGKVEPWLWGLLPDNWEILRRWGQRYHVSPSNAFALLGSVGEDCPGAIQIVRPDRVKTVLDDNGGQVEWLTESDMAERLRILRSDNAAWRLASDTGKFSLAGAQPKTALLFDGSRWGVPSGSTPTTHIIKPPIEGLNGHAENEHFCLALARGLGLPAARSEVCRFDDETAIVVERYDRIRNTDSIRRIHQEDMCQAAGGPPSMKYQNEGGPGCATMSELIRTHSQSPDEDTWNFARAIMLNWLIGGTDAHAKNFSLLIGAGGSSRLAPLYDVASVLPYDYRKRHLKMAAKIGGEFRFDYIFPRHWARFASELRLPPSEVIETIKSMAASLPGAMAKVLAATRVDKLDHPILKRIFDDISQRAKKCSRVLDEG